MNIAVTILLIIVVGLAIRLGLNVCYPLSRRKQIIISISTLIGILLLTVIQFINNSGTMINITNLFVLLLWGIVVKEIIDDDDVTPNEFKLA